MMFLQAEGKGRWLATDILAKDTVMACCTTHKTGTSFTSSMGSVKVSPADTLSFKGINSYLFSLPPDLLLPHRIPIPASSRLSNL